MHIGCSDEGENGDGKEDSEIPEEWESRDYLGFCMQMTWFCVVVGGRPEGDGEVVC